MKKSVALLVESPFSERDYQRFGVVTLQREFDVSILDLTSWLKPRVWKNLSHTTFAPPNYRPISTAEQCRADLRANRYLFAFDYLSTSAKANSVRGELKRLGIARITVSTGLVPTLPRRNVFKQLASLKYRTNKLAVLISWIRKLILARCRITLTPEFAVVTGTASLHDPAIRDAKKIWAHSPDYDIFLDVGRRSQHPNNAYAVYADEDCAFHPDFLHDNIKPFVRPESFYPALMHFFREFEEKSGLAVIIAAHPRSRWEDRSELLEGREAVKGKTAELMAGAALVFAHASTSISFAVLSRVPLVFLTSDEMDNSFYRDEVRMRSEVFSAPLINIDHFGDEECRAAAVAGVDGHAYEDYRERYIKKSGTQDIPLWDIIVSQIGAQKFP